MKLSIIVSVILALLMTTSVVYLENRNIYYTNISLEQLTPAAQKEVRCLADNVFFESVGESKAGQIAVARVTINRFKSGKYAKSICGVVRQKTGGTCQFSWWCDATSRRLATTRKLTNVQKVAYNEVMDLALYVYLNYEVMIDNTKGATFYHADYVNPNWKQLKKTVKIGRHIFYTNGELNGGNDEKTKHSTGTRKSRAFVFLANGRNYNVYLQTNYRMDI